MRALVLSATLLLAACSGGASQGSGATPGEDKALDEAAASLDANSADSNAAVVVDDDEGGNEEQAQ